MNKGKVGAQVIEIARSKLSDFNSVFFGHITFELRFGNIYRVIVHSEQLVGDKEKKPREILKDKSKEELVDMVLGKV